MGRNTTTGSKYEKLIADVIKHSCEKNNYTYNPQVAIGKRPIGGEHIIDWLLIDNTDLNRRGLISCKVQNVSGTAEEKIAYEVIKLLFAMKNDSRYVHSWIILGGIGWSPGLYDFLTKELPNWVPEMKEQISILNTDQLISMDLTIPSN